MSATVFSPRINVPLPEPFRQLGVEGESDQSGSMRFDSCVCAVRSADLRCKALRQWPIFANVLQKGFPTKAFPIGRPEEAFVASIEGVMGERSFIKGSIA
jgi:hypothetical protein